MRFARDERLNRSQKLNDAAVDPAERLMIDPLESGFIATPPAAVMSAQFVQFSPDPDAKDYVLATIWDTVSVPPVGTAPSRIALPWLLRRRPFDGQTRAGISYTYTDQTTRDADDGGGPVEEILVPSFEIGDVLYFTAVFPHTGVPVDSADLNAGYVEWLMLNDGRMWSRDSSSSGG